jgi:hypothetical protein
VADEARVERLLGEMAAEVEWPPTPDIASSVGRRIRRRRPGLTVLLLAAALAGALALGTAVTIYVGLRGVTISRVQSLPPTPASPSASSAGAAAVGTRLKLGSLYPSRAAVQQAAGFRPLVPTSLGEPDQVYYRADAGVVTLLYRPRPGLPATSDPEVGALVMELRASVDQGSFGKMVGAGATIEPVSVHGGRGYWISGAPHGFLIYQRTGTYDEFRLTGDVLVWTEGELAIRIESALSRDQALAAASGVR